MQVVKVTKENRSKVGDIFKWSVVVVGLIAGIAANYYFVHQPLPLRLAGWIDEQNSS